MVDPPYPAEKLSSDEQLLHQSSFTGKPDCTTPSSFEDLSGPVLQSVASFRESTKLLREEYLKANHLADDTLPYHPLELDRSSVTLGIRNGDGEVAARGTLVLMGGPEWSSSLPCADQPEFAEILQDTSGLKAEVTRLATSQERGDIRLTRSLMDDVAMMSLALKVHSLFLVCHPRHEDFYIRCFEADPLLTVNSYAGVNEKPGTLMKITPEDFYSFTRWTPGVLQGRQFAGAIQSELSRMKMLYEQRVQAGPHLRSSF